MGDIKTDFSLRRHVSIAKFYDWTGDLFQCVSVSKSTIHENMNDFPRSRSEKGKLQNIPWCSDGVRVTPGRMYSREKGQLTKGQTDVINGLFQNRGNLIQNGVSQIPESHSKAWRVGKDSRNVTSLHGNRSDSVCSGVYAVPDVKTFEKVTSVPHLAARNNRQEGKNISGVFISPKTFNVFPSKEKLCEKKRNVEKSVIKEDKSECSGLSADEDQSRDKTNKRVDPENISTSGDRFSNEEKYGNTSPLSEPVALVKECSEESVEGSENITAGEKSRNRRLLMEVYLPTIPHDPTEDDIQKSLQEGRPLLERESPMSHTHFKFKTYSNRY